MFFSSPYLCGLSTIRPVRVISRNGEIRGICKPQLLGILWMCTDLILIPIQLVQGLAKGK